MTYPVHLCEPNTSLSCHSLPFKIKENNTQGGYENEIVPMHSFAFSLKHIMFF